MNKQAILKIINPLLLVSVVVQATTGLIFFFDLQVPHLKTLMEIHGYNGLLMVLLAVTHVSLNWSWIRASYFRK